MKCKICNIKFTPTFFNQKTCSDKECMGEYAVILIEKNREAKRKKEAKDWKEKKSELKEKNKTHSELLNDLQKVFNTYIRERDKNKPCISCLGVLSGKYDAGHYFSVGAYPNLRFNEDNVHGQCVHCNQHLHGNHIEYGIKLVNRIGEAAVEQLLEKRKDILKLSKEEIKEKILYYKNRIKEIISTSSLA